MILRDGVLCKGSKLVLLCLMLVVYICGVISPLLLGQLSRYEFS